MGGYPPGMVDMIGRRSREEGRAWSRLPTMSKEDIELIRGKADFLGLNYYSSNRAEPAAVIKREPSMWNDQELEVSLDESWPQAKSSWLRSIPDGLRQILK